MKTLLFTLLITLLSLIGYSQTSGYKVYCELKMFHTFNGGVEARVDLGAKYSNTYYRDDVIGDENGEKIIFHSPVAVLNYMSKRGWDIEYKITNADSISHGSYLLTKTVTNDEKITSGIYFSMKKSRQKNNQEGKKD
ncbi:MAG: hypothetical protein II937_04785 [Bacteroidales bacterium]|nr:hypothetical protein [Bacteroidales bacterium]